MKMFITFAVLFTLCTQNLFSQWQPDTRLTNFANASYTSYNNAWNVASNGNIVHTVWWDNRLDPINYEIYYKRSTDAGVSWGADIRLTNNTGDSQYPSVSVSGSVVHVAWQDRRDGNFEIYYKRSTDAGVSWGADTRLTNGVFDSWHPSVSVAGSNVNIAWQDRRDVDDEIYYKRSTDEGVSWGADVRLTNNAGVSAIPSVSASGLYIHVVWDDTRDGNAEIYYKRSTNGGESWGADTRLTNNSASSTSASVVVSDSVVHVTWQDRRDEWEIYYIRSTDAGAGWGAETRLTNDAASSWYPNLSVSGSVVHIVWQERRDGNDEIYYKRSTDDGVSWESDTRLTFFVSGSGAWNPSVAVSGTVVHVVWNDYRIGSEIWYKHNPTGNPVGILSINSEVPEKFSLSQNYPNPYNPVTNLEFGISKSGFVSLKVYDVQGREVSTLVNERLAPGTYKVDFNGSNFTSGVYFYRLITGKFIETKKMILTK
ncbi:MAG: T9SS type A sorting domain-containing protein [Ignavibacteria bacterium]|nr:T9SS type A sorting domain-containing protein [Ignavibacteria bacterium]